MLTAIPRYGARVLSNTQQLIAEIERRGQFIEGPHIAEFERAFGDRLGGVHAIATSYGRMAFYYILKALDLPAGSEIVLPALTFWVMPEMARVAGLRPVFADVDPTTFTMTPASLERVVSSKTSAVVPTHLWGLPCDMDGILEVARRHKLAVIEDCAHALGATYRGRPVGTLGDAALFSFQTLKPLNTYGGGMAVTSDAALAARVRDIAESEPLPTKERVRARLWHGRVQRIAIRPRVFTWTLFPVLWVSALFDSNPDMYLWEETRRLDPQPAGYRERYSNVQAAIGLEALKQLDGWTARTQANAARVSSALADVPGVRVPIVPADRTHAFYQYCAYVPLRDETVHGCLKRGVDLETLHVDVCSRLPIFEAFAASSPGADDSEHAIQIPVYESLTAADIDRIARVVRSAALDRATEAVPATARG